MKFKEVVRRALARRNVQIALATGLASVSSLSMAADGSFDTGESLGWIAAGVAAALLITGAMFGLVTLVGAAKKAQRAGT